MRAIRAKRGAPRPVRGACRQHGRTHTAPGGRPVRGGRRSPVDNRFVEIGLETTTPDGLRVVLPALVYATAVRSTAVADLERSIVRSVALTSVARIRDRVGRRCWQVRIVR